MGLDFYCDLLIDDKPLLPFYVQAKSSEHWDKNQGRSINKGTIVFWLSKPYPVYIHFYDEADDICYWYSVEKDRYDLISKLFSTESESIYISFSKEQVFNKDDNPDFRTQLKKDYHSLMAFLGTPQFEGEGYVKSIPPPPRSGYEYELIKMNARACLYSLFQLHIAQKDVDMAITFAESVAMFDKSHHTHFEWLGYLYKEKGDKQKARGNFKSAIDICEKDGNFDPTLKEEWVNRLNNEIDKLNETQPHARR